jgi:tryptophan halogenase
MEPYTKAFAHPWGWQWTIPLQHRTGNGIVYESTSVSDDYVVSALMANIETRNLAEPNFIRFKAGHRKKLWNKNCVAIGLAGGFLEPLESTSIYLIQQGILKLLEYFPSEGYENILRDTYNNEMETEYLRIRDFLILHYKITQREDSEFWKYCKNMTLPDSLSRKMQLFCESGYIERYEYGLFMPPSWLAVYFGQGMAGFKFDRRVFNCSREIIASQLKQIRKQLNKCVNNMPFAHEVLLKEVMTTEKYFRYGAASLYGVSCTQ